MSDWRTMPRPRSMLERHAAVHAALGDPHRLAIVEALQLRLHWSVPDPAVSGDRQGFDQAISSLEACVEALHQVMAA